jgi:hypothetical protein
MPATGSACWPSPLRQASHRREAQAARADLHGGPAAGWHGAHPVEHERHGVSRLQGTAEEEAWPLSIMCAATRETWILAQGLGELLALSVLLAQTS